MESKGPHKRKCTNHPFKHKKTPKKWYDKECRDLKNICRRLAISKQQNHTDIDIRKHHSIALKEYKKLCNTKKMIFEQSQIRRLEELSENPTEFWKNWKSFGDTYNSINTPMNADGKKWETYFRKLYRNTGSNRVPPIPLQQQDIDINNTLNIPFLMKELNEIINKLKNKKAAGLDRILVEFLKASPEATRALLLRLLNIIYTSNIVPKDWCLGILSPIYKEGSKDNPDNYRGICISSTFAKILSTMMNARLTKLVLDRNLLNKEQIGFQADNRTSDHILTIKSVVNKYVQDKHGDLYTCFIDFKKAFDTVWHDGLFYKLQEIGICGNFLLILQNMYKNTKCAVKIGDKLIQLFPCKQGVMTRGSTKPILFN